MKTIILYLLLLIPTLSFSQIESPVKWETKVNKVNDTIAELVFEVDIENQWHLYAQDFQEGGPIPLVFDYEENENYKLIGKTTENPKSIEEFDDIFEINVKYIKGKAVFKQRIKINSDKPFVIKVSVTAQACKEMCIMVGDDFEFEVNK